MPVRSTVTREDARRVVATLRAAVERDPERFAALALILDGVPTDGDGEDDWGSVELPDGDDADELAPARRRRAPVRRRAGDRTAGPYELAPARDTRRRRAARRDATEAAQDVFRDQTAELASAYHAGELSADAFRDAFRLLVKDVHIAAAVAGSEGGWADMTKSDWGRVGRTIRDQYGFAENMISEFEADRGTEDSVSEAQLRARMDMYADAASQSRSKQEVAARGFDPALLPAHPGDGSTECRARCKCTWTVRVLSVKRAEYRATWTLGAAEHCSTCRSRATAWRSLTISGGELQDAPDREGTFR